MCDQVCDPAESQHVDHSASADWSQQPRASQHHLTGKHSWLIKLQKFFAFFDIFLHNLTANFSEQFCLNLYKAILLPVLIPFYFRSESGGIHQDDQRG